MKNTNQVFYCGIDLSASPKETGLCILKESENLSVVKKPSQGDLKFEEWSEEALQALIAYLTSNGVFKSAQDEVVIAIDVPFGWPVPFAEALQAHRAGKRIQKPWNTKARREELRYRKTDLFVWRTIGKKPLSVSTDRLGITAMAGASLISELIARFGFEVDVFGKKTKRSKRRIIEVYPTGSYQALYLPRHEGAPPEGNLKRGFALNLRYFHGGDHARDAYLSAMTAKLYQNNQCHFPPAEIKRSFLQREGWIWLPHLGR